MSTRFEQFMRDHRNQFDTDEPDDQVWKKLEQELHGDKNQHAKSNKQRVVLLTIFRWSTAAAILILAGVGVFSLLNNKNTTPPDMAQNPVTPDTPATAGDAILKEINPTYAQEVYHFTRLIELKQNELREIEKDDPHLYKKFVSDINKLDSSYNALRRELPENPNREQLLQAMIENLRLQTEILNQQLNIINQIKASKGDRHESDFKKT